MNDADKAAQWTKFLAARGDVPASALLLEHFNAGTITRICYCGCNSYDLKVRKESGLRPLIPASQRGGCVFSMQFNLSNRPGTVEIDVFVDPDGYLAGIDVACNANSEPVPENPQLVEPPYHVYGALMKHGE
jgi:hypothetical protein